MKTYEEVAKSVFEKSEKYFEEKAVRARRIKTAATAMSCFCLAAVLVVGAIAALNGNLTEYPTGGGTEGQLAGEPENNDNILVSGETTTVSDVEPTITDTGNPNDPSETAEGNTDAVCQLPPADPNFQYQNCYWQTVEEILGEDYGIEHHGVIVSNFLAYDGALYVSYSPEDEKTGRYYAPMGYAYFGENFTCTAYAVKDEPNLIAIELNSTIWEYKKLFDCNFEIDGEKFRIAYSALKDIDHACGDIILQTEDFTVYEAVRLQGEPSDTKEYIVDLLPVLERELPDLFSDTDDADYGDRWWIALPAIPEDIQSDNDVPEYEISDDPSLPNNTLVGVTPKDTDQILAAAQSVSSEYYRSVFVLAETGSEVYSLVDGVVVMAEYNGISGYFIEVETADGRHIRHSHLSEMLAEVGDTVTKDQVIGLAGTTGYASCSGVGYCFITG